MGISLDELADGSGIEFPLLVVERSPGACYGLRRLVHRVMRLYLEVHVRDNPEIS
jgi:hypothetical protein